MFLHDNYMSEFQAALARQAMFRHDNGVVVGLRYVCES